MRISALFTMAAGLVVAACSAPAPGSPTGGDANPVREQVHAGRTAESTAESDAEKTDEPEDAQRWRRLRWQDESGQIDPLGIVRARQQRAANADFHALIDDAGIGRYGWQELGPNNIGGRSRSLLINPNNPQELWGGSVGGGIWHSTDGGASWAPVDDHLGGSAIGCMAMDPTDPNLIYAGTGEGYYNGDALSGIGILRSTDGGQSFQVLPSTTSFSHTNRIAISPANPQILLAGVRGGGIFRSTNGGQSWTLVRAADNCLQVLIDPNDANKCVADLYEGGNHKVAYSLNAGASWVDAASGLVAQAGTSGRIELCYARSTPSMVYASCGTNGGLIWRSTDGGANWTLRTTGTGSGAAWYYNSLWVDPTDSNFLVTGAYHIYKSTNGGSSLSRISNGYIDTQQPHPDVHFFLEEAGFNGSTNRRLYVATDGGIYFTTDIRTASRTSGWSRRDQSYRASQFYGAAGDGTSGRITGGTQDNGHLTLQNGSTTASLTFGGDGGFAAIDWLNPNYIYGEYVYAQVHRSTDGGTSANYIDGGIGDAGSSSTANFIAPIVLDPSDPTRLFVGGTSLWRTTNARQSSVSWTSIKVSVGSKISAIAIAPGNANVIWVGHNDGRIYRTSSGTAATPTWIAVDDNAGTNPLPNRYVNRILIDLNDSNTAYVALAGFSTGNLQRTTNAGSSFVSVTGSGVTGLPDAPVYGICQHPVMLDHLYAATEVGVFASDDGGANWSTGNDGPADTSAEEIVFLHNSARLLIATHGRGLWTSDIHESSSVVAGPGCAGMRGVPALVGDPPRIGQSMTLTTSSLAFGSTAWLLLGVSDTNWGTTPLPLDLSPLGMPGCFLRCSLELVDGKPAPVGGVVHQLAVPAQTRLVGATFFVQTLALDPVTNAGGAVISNSLQCTVGY